MPNAYDETYNAGVAMGDPRMSSAETGAKLTAMPTEIAAGFITHFAARAR